MRGWGYVCIMLIMIECVFYLRMTRKTRKKTRNFQMENTMLKGRFSEQQEQILQLMSKVDHEEV